VSPLIYEIMMFVALPGLPIKMKIAGGSMIDLTSDRYKRKMPGWTVHFLLPEVRLNRYD